MLRANAHTDAASLAVEVIGQNPSVHTGDAYFWDPLAAAVTLVPSLVTTHQAPITVVTTEGSDSGRTIRSADGSPVSVAVDAVGEVLEDVLIRALNGLGPDAPFA